MLSNMKTFMIEGLFIKNRIGLPYYNEADSLQRATLSGTMLFKPIYYDGKIVVDLNIKYSNGWSGGGHFKNIKYLYNYLSYMDLYNASRLILTLIRDNHNVLVEDLDNNKDVILYLMLGRSSYTASFTTERYRKDKRCNGTYDEDIHINSSFFIEGQLFEQKGQITDAIDLYEQAEKVEDRCAIFHWNCIDRYGMLGQPINYSNQVDWEKFSLTSEEAELLLAYYRESETVESLFRQAIIYNIMKNFDNSLIYLKRTCAQNYGPACNYLGFQYHYGKCGLSVDYVQAQFWYLKASQYEFAIAEANLGDLYANIHKNYEEAMKWYQLAVDHGNLIMWYQIGLLYQKGLCIEKDIDRAMECYMKITDFSNAQFALGELYHSQKKDDEALKWSILAAKQGHIQALFLTGYLYRLKDNFEEAIKWYRLASDQDHITANYNLGIIFDRNNEHEQALKYFTLAAEAGHANAQKELFFIYKDGLGTSVNIEKARHYCKLSATQNNLEALYLLGQSYQLDEPIDYTLASKYYTLAVNQGYSSALINLGWLYDQGLGVLQNHEIAFGLWYLPGEKGNILGCYNIAHVYHEKHDYNNAIIWYEKGSNYNKSLYRLGTIYKKGQGVPVDHTKAFQYFKQACDKVDQIDQPDLQDKYAFEELALCYYYGLGTPKNYELALKYFQKVNLNSYIVKIQDYKGIIITLLNKYIHKDTNEGASYLFFANFLGYLTKKQTALSWEDPLLRRWITEALMSYFKIINPNFEESLIDQWYDDFY